MAPNPIITKLGCENEKGRIKVLPTLKVDKWEGVWALGTAHVFQTSMERLPSSHSTTRYPRG